MELPAQDRADTANLWGKLVRVLDRHAERLFRVSWSEALKGKWKVKGIDGERGNEGE